MGAWCRRSTYTYEFAVACTAKQSQTIAATAATALSPSAPYTLGPARAADGLNLSRFAGADAPTRELVESRPADQPLTQLSGAVANSVGGTEEWLLPMSANKACAVTSICK